MGWMLGMASHLGRKDGDTAMSMRRQTKREKPAKFVRAIERKNKREARQYAGVSV